MPVYNKEKTLAESIKSVINQTFSNWELICIEDCSIDSTKSILLKYSKIDSRIKIIHHNLNLGTMQSRIDGVDMASGDYIMFLDSDDALKSNALSVAFNAITDLNTDIVHFGTQLNCTDDLDSKEIAWMDNFLKPYPSKLFNRDVFDGCFKSQIYRFSLWNKIYRADICKVAHLMLKDNHNCVAEDLYEYFAIAYVAKSYAGINEVLYEYNFSSGITFNTTPNSIKKHCTQVDIYNKCIEFLTETGEFFEYYQTLNRIGINLVNACLNLCPKIKNRSGLQLASKLIYESWIDTPLKFTVMDNLNIFKLPDKFKKTVENDIILAFCVNDSFIPMFYATFNSFLLHSSSNYNYYVHILHENISESNKKILNDHCNGYANVKLIFDNISDMIDADRDLLVPVAHFGKETYYRFYIPECIPDSDKVLYLDADLIINADVADLYQATMDDFLIAGCIDYTFGKERERLLKIGLDPRYYINAGVLLMNTNMMIKINMRNQCIELLSKLNNIWYPDQDVINIVAENHKLIIPQTWNYLWHALWITPADNEFPAYQNVMRRLVPSANIIHYCGSKKPWNSKRKEVDSKLYALFWKYCDNKTYKKQLKQRLKSSK